MRIVFMGTPMFAVPTLKKLTASSHEVVGVYTKAPKPAGRGQKESKSAVHTIAEQLDLSVFTPKTFKDPGNVEQLRKLKPDVLVVAAYGLILRQEVLDIPKICALNIHPSALPRWRGAAPIQRTILSGDDKTEICIMRMDAGLDTGDVQIRYPLEITTNMTAYQLHDFAAEKGADLILEALGQLASGTAKFIPQSEKGITYAEKLTKQDERINFNNKCKQLSCQIRALTPKPAAFFEFKGEIIKIIESDFSIEPHNFEPGEVVDEILTIATADGFLYPKLLQRQGKKMIYTDAFLRGFTVNKGDILEG